MGRRKRFTLMPAIALAALSLMVALPTLSSMRLYAASTQRYTTVTVQPGDTLWSIAAAHTGSTDVQETIDRITAVNHLRGARFNPASTCGSPTNRTRVNCRRRPAAPFFMSGAKPGRRYVPGDRPGTRSPPSSTSPARRAECFATSRTT